jgi:hypothetical protein
MHKKSNIILTALCGIFGSLILAISFRINPAPPQYYTTAQLVEFVLQHHFSIVIGGWMQAVGTILSVLFVLSLVHLGKYSDKLSGWITLLASVCILMISLIEVTFYLAATNAFITNDIITGNLANSIIKSVQHVFLLAPAILLPLGYILVKTKLLNLFIGYFGILLTRQ